MPPPDFTRLGQRLRDRTSYLQEDDAKYDYAHGHLCEALMRPLAQTAELVDPEDPWPPWAPLFNIDICPDWAIPWLAQLVGVRFPKSLTADDARHYIRGMAFLTRGSPSSIMAAAQTQLTGSQLVWLRERDAGDPYRLELIVRASELKTDLQAVIDTVMPVKPAGLILSIRVSDTWDYQQMTTEYVGQTYDDMKDDYLTYADLSGGPLG